MLFRISLFPLSFLPAFNLLSYPLSFLWPPGDLCPVTFFGTVGHLCNVTSPRQMLPITVRNMPSISPLILKRLKVQFSFPATCPSLSVLPMQAALNRRQILVLLLQLTNCSGCYCSWMLNSFEGQRSFLSGIISKSIMSFNPSIFSSTALIMAADELEPSPADFVHTRG